MRVIFVAAIAALGLTLGCGGGGKPGAATPAPTAKLYDRLGGQPAVEKVIDDFLRNVAGDTRISLFFTNTDLPKLRARLIEQVCVATGGPCTYKGKDMKTVHKGMKVKDADFDALVEDLVQALDANHVAAADKAELLGLLAPMRRDIVEK